MFVKENISLFFQNLFKTNLCNYTIVTLKPLIFVCSDIWVVVTWLCAFAQMDNHPIKQVVVRVLGLFGALWIHIFWNKLSEIERFRKIHMFVQFLSAPVKSKQLDHQNSRSLHYGKSFSRLLFLFASFTLIFVVSGQSFYFAELLNALLKVLMMSYIERKGKKRFIFVWFTVTR